MLTADQLGRVIQDLLAVYQAERERLDEIAAALQNKALGIYIPRGATAEYKLLVEQSRFNVLPLFVKQLAQDLFVDGYRPTGETGRAPSATNSPIWDAVWQPNRMDARQGSIYRAAIKFGWSYATVVKGQPAPVITPHSPRQFVALYEDELNDEWPRYAMRLYRPPKRSSSGRRARSAEPDVGAKLTVYDAEAVYEVQRSELGWEIVGGQAKVHGLGVTPVVRYLDEWDCDDMPTGKIQPLLAPQASLNQTTFGLSMAQQFGAFKQRWVSGMADEEPKFKARVDAILASDSPDTKWGEFSETDLTGYLKTRESTMLFMATVGQAAPHQIVIGAGISNISADALVALQTSHDHDVAEHKTSFGESTEQLLRLSGKALGTPEGEEAWADTSAQVVWRDTTPRSLAQIADALGKLAQQLGIPPEALWERIPGVTDQDIEMWKAMRQETDLMGGIDEMMRNLPSGDEEVPVAVGSSNGADGSAPV